MKLSKLVSSGFFILICVCQLARTQDAADLSLVSQQTILTPLQASDLEKAIESLPFDLVRIDLATWIKTAKSGSYERAVNASMAILCAAMRSDGWEIISDRYPEILDLLHSPYPYVQRWSLLVAVNQGIREPHATALALRSLVSSKAHVETELSLRASAVQELLQLEPGSEAAHDAIDRLLSENLSMDDRLMVIESLAIERPASERTLAILISALDDKSPVLREGAVLSLERLSDAGSDVFGRAGLQLLRMSSEDPEPRVRAAAKDALSHPPGTHAPLHIGVAN